MSNMTGTPTPPGQPAALQNRAAAAAVMRRPAASPFMQKKPRYPRGRPPPPRSANGASTGLAPAPSNRPTSIPNSAATSAPVQQPTAPNYVDYPIFISKADLGRGARFHGIRFQQKAVSGSGSMSVDPYSEEQFTRPLRLHRRYTRDKQKGANLDEGANGVDDKEREMYNARRAERIAEREANQALIAPSGGSKKPPMKRKKNQKGVEDVYYDDKDPKQQKAAQLRYEETKPWHLEDFDGKNVWVGSYQEPLSENSVLFTVSADGFQMVPVERWYTFRQTDKITVMNSEEVEKHMSKRYLPGRWYMKTQDQNEEERRQRSAQARRRARGDDDDDVKPKRAAEDAYRADLDELDFEAKDEFQDDDEGLIFGEEEDDAKEVEKRVREEMREANLPATNMKNDDKDWDEEEDKEKEEQKAERRQQKKLRKRIVKHEKKFEYDSDSDHPYSDSSDTEDSDEERQRLEEERKKEEALKPSQSNGGRSGVSTPGGNTPAGRSEKRDQARLNGVHGASLKRPGSPNLSEISGSDSRKKAKGMNGRAISSSNLAADGGARSPAPRLLSGHGSGSDTDTSRAGVKKKRKAGSPDPSQPGSRAQSPTRAGTPPPRMPTEEEIRAAIPADGISIKDLSGRFRARVSKDKTVEFIGLIRRLTTQDPVTKLLKPSNKSAGESA